MNSLLIQTSNQLACVQAVPLKKIWRWNDLGMCVTCYIVRGEHDMLRKMIEETEMEETKRQKVNNVTGIWLMDR